MKFLLRIFQSSQMMRDTAGHAGVSAFGYTTCELPMLIHRRCS
jgi:hypothetical protein